MKKTELREKKLIEMLKNRQRMSISSVINELNISEATARRLFARLEVENKLIRVHGGIQAVPEINSDYSFKLSIAQKSMEKSEIGRKAAILVENGDRIFLDAGSTVLKMAEELSLRIQGGELENITVITNSLSFTGNLAEVCEVILIGGRIRSGRCDVCGALTRQNLEKFRFDKVFFGVDAISKDGELMTTDSETAEINTLFMSRSKEVFVLADDSKFNSTSLVTFATVDDVTEVISNSD